MNLKKELKTIADLPATTQQIALAAFLSRLFEKEKVGLTVVGGAAVQYYTGAEYVTKDIDAILSGDTKEVVDRVMTAAGFKRATTYRHFEHPLFPFVVEFPPAPVEVAGRYISDFNILKMGDRSVRVIRVEDIIIDRLTGGIEWKSEKSMNQARLLWIKNKKYIDQKYLTEFAKAEGYLKALKDIMKVE